MTDDMEKIKAYMAAKMKHIKMYNECMNLADGLNVEKFAELVRAVEREACANLCEEHFMSDGIWCAKRIRARGEK
jgi:hypothetical protein